MAPMTPPELWLKEYAGSHGYVATYEPNWDEIFGRVFGTNPDFLIERDDSKAIAEVRDFESWRFSEFLAEREKGGVIPPQITVMPIFQALKEKAAQLEPFAVTGEPLVIVLARTGQSDVILDDHHLLSAMFGDLAIQLAVPTSTGAADSAQFIAQPGYGVFRATKDDDTPWNPRPHVSGVAVLGRDDLYAEFQVTDLQRVLEERKPANQEERERLAEEWLKSPVAKGDAAGPAGYGYRVTYYDLNRYAFGHGPPVGDDWFTSPADRRYGFDPSGTTFSPRT